MTEYMKQKGFVAYLSLWHTTLISDQEKITLIIYEDFLFKATTFRRFLMHEGASKIPVNESRLSRV